MAGKAAGAPRQMIDPAGDDLLGAFQGRQEDEFLPGDGFPDQDLAHQGAFQGLGHNLVLHQEELARLVLEQFRRQGAVPSLVASSRTWLRPAQARTSESTGMPSFWAIGRRS